MRLFPLLLALVAAACTPTAALAQSLTLTNLKAPIAKASGKAPAKSIADLWAQINALPVPDAPVEEKVYKPGEVDAEWYHATYADIPASDAVRHWNTSGKWEGRLPYKGAAKWKPDANISPAEYFNAPGCDVTTGPVWAPAGSREVRIQFQLTRFGDGTACERSFAMMAGFSNWSSGSDNRGWPGFNISAGGSVSPEVTVLPSQGSRGEIVISIPAWMGPTGGFHVWMRSAEYNPIARTEFDVFVGGDRPADARYYPEALVLPAPTPYPADLGKPTYTTDFREDLASDGWTYWDMGGLNGMIGAFTLPTTKTASGKLTDNYPIVDGVRQLVLRDHRSDPVQGKALFSSPMITRMLGDGKLGYRMTVMSLPMALPGSDAALWGVVPGVWPPEMDTHEGFAGDPRVYQTVHMPNGGTTSFTPWADVTGKHEWLEEYGSQTYRLWLDKRLVIERPNLLVGHGIATTLSIEGPGGAGGAVDLAQPYDGMAIGLYQLSWWQR